MIFDGILSEEDQRMILGLAEAEAQATGQINDLPLPTVEIPADVRDNSQTVTDSTVSRETET